jgi:hypothetical protein
VLHHLGRVPLDNNQPAEAIRYFQLGQIAAQDSDSLIAVAFLHANEAVAYAHHNDAPKALTALRRAEDEYAHAQTHDTPEFLQFFDKGALETATARVYSTLALTNDTYRDNAVERLRGALTTLSPARSRQRAFNLTWLATLYLAGGETDTGKELGNQAVATVRELNSQRLINHLAPLHQQTKNHPKSEIAQLGNEINGLRNDASLCGI